MPKSHVLRGQRKYIVASKVLHSQSFHAGHVTISRHVSILGVVLGSAEARQTWRNNGPLSCHYDKVTGRLAPFTEIMNCHLAPDVWVGSTRVIITQRHQCIDPADGVIELGLDVLCGGT